MRFCFNLKPINLFKCVFVIDSYWMFVSHLLRSLVSLDSCYWMHLNNQLTKCQMRFEVQFSRKKRTEENLNDWFIVERKSKTIELLIRCWKVTNTQRHTKTPNEVNNWVCHLQANDMHIDASVNVFNMMKEYFDNIL